MEVKIVTAPDVDDKEKLSTPLKQEIMTPPKSTEVTEKKIEEPTPVATV